MHRKQITSDATAAINASYRMLDWIEKKERGPLGPLLKKLPPAIAQRVLETPRIQNRPSKSLPKLVKLFIEHPNLTGWFESPIKLRQLGMISGATRCSNLLRGLIDQNEIKLVTSSIGDNAWNYATQRDGKDIALSAGPFGIVECISNESERSLHHFVRAIFPDLYSEIENGCAANWQRFNQYGRGDDYVAETWDIVRTVAP